MSETNSFLLPYTVDDSGVVLASDGFPFMLVYGETPQRQERTEFIVRACNSHDALLATCSDLIDAFWDMSPLEYAYSRGMNSMSDAEGERIKQRARDAIAKAKP